MQFDDNSSVVIYGGGVAGAVLAKSLAKRTRVTLVDPLDYFEVPMAAPRSLVDPHFAEKSIISFAEALPGVRHIRARLQELLPGERGLVSDESGTQQVISGGTVVLATGSRYSNPLMRGVGGSGDERRQFYRTYSERLTRAKTILIVGGGPIGVEVAGEITENFSDKDVYLLDSGSRVLRGTAPAAAEHAEGFLRKKGVTFIFDDRVANSTGTPQDVFADAGEAVTVKGRRIPYDLLIWCTGGAPSTSYMNQHYGHLLTPSHHIRVQPTLQVMDQMRLFALGDITDLKENKMAWHIQGQVPVATANVLNVLGLSPSCASGRFRTYRAKTDNPSMAVTLGSEAGVVQLPLVGTIRSAGFSRMVKAREMLVPKYRSLFLG